MQMPPIITIIKPKKTILWQDFQEIWLYRELLYFLTWRNLKIRYKQTSIGIAWAIIQPFVAMVIFTVLFGKVVQIPTAGIPYPIFVFVGLLFWQFFSGAITEGANSMVNNASIITKVYFPRWILPTSNVIDKLVDFFISILILIGMMVYYQYTPSLIGLMLIPILIILTFMAALACSILLTAIDVWYRDVRYALPFIIQILFFVTPIVYPSQLAGSYSWILALNPMSGIIEAGRAALFATGPINWTILGISTVSIIILCLIGSVVFFKSERKFADII